MKNGRYFAHKYVYAFIFILLIFAYSGYNLYLNGEALLADAKSAVESIKLDPLNNTTKAVASLDTKLTERMLCRMEFIETYSFSQKILDKREINNFAYIKDETGSLHYSTFFRDEENDCFEYALRVKRLQDFVEPLGTNVLFVVAPSKYTTEQTPLRTGLSPNDPSNIVNEMLFYLNRLGIETLDLGDYIPNRSVPYEEAFFRTDHHWTIPAAFEASRVVAQEMNERFGYSLDYDKYLNRENFDEVVYYGGMLGSMGRKTGASFSGVDDFTALYPRYNMLFKRHTLEEGGWYSDRTGDIIGTLILPEVLKSNKDIYSDSQYSMYLNGLRTYEHITNETDGTGPSVFMIRDSYFSPVISFLAPMCSRIDAMWSLEDREELDIEQYVRDNKFDVIIIEMYPFNIGEDAFQFFRGE